jgi:hypothetical protein
MVKRAVFIFRIFMLDKANDNFMLAGRDGVLWCYIIEPDKSAQLCSIDDINAYQGSGYTWVHMQSDELDTALTLKKLGLALSRIESLCALET